MRRTAIVTAAAVVGLLTISVPAAAFHGASWIGQGTASDPITGVDRHAVVDWSGQQAGNTGTVKVTIGNLGPFTLQAEEDVSNVAIDGCIETVEPYFLNGTAENDFEFHLTGAQVNDLCSDCFCEANSHYEGRFGIWDLSIDVDGDKDTLEDG